MSGTLVLGDLTTRRLLSLNRQNQRADNDRCEGEDALHDVQPKEDQSEYDKWRMAYDE